MNPSTSSHKDIDKDERGTESVDETKPRVVAEEIPVYEGKYRSEKKKISDPLILSKNASFRFHGTILYRGYRAVEPWLPSGPSINGRTWIKKNPEFTHLLAGTGHESTLLRTLQPLKKPILLLSK